MNVSGFTTAFSSDLSSTVHSRLSTSKLHLLHVELFLISLSEPNRLFSDEYAQPTPSSLFCSRKAYVCTFHQCPKKRMQSGQSQIEHSYRADSDLSPEGWEYAERLKQFVLERRAKNLQERGLNPATRKLVVCCFYLDIGIEDSYWRAIQIWTSARR